MFGNLEVTHEAGNFRYSVFFFWNFFLIVRQLNLNGICWGGFVIWNLDWKFRKHDCFLILRKISFRCWHRCHCPLIKGLTKLWNGLIFKHLISLLPVCLSILRRVFWNIHFCNSSSDRFRRPCVRCPLFNVNCYRLDCYITFFVFLKKKKKKKFWWDIKEKIVFCILRSVLYFELVVNVSILNGARSSGVGIWSLFQLKPLKWKWSWFILWLRFFFVSFNCAHRSTIFKILKWGNN